MRFPLPGRLAIPLLAVTALAASAAAERYRPAGEEPRAAEREVASSMERAPVLAAPAPPSAPWAAQAQWPRQQRGIHSPNSLPPHSFYFTRAAYSGGGRGWRSINSWATDYPKADQQFLVVLQRLANIDAYPMDNAVSLDDPDLWRFPFLYALEVGFMDLTPTEVEGLRNYLLSGGFLMIDDFWGTSQWRNFEYQMGRVLPEYPIVELPMDHPIFSAMYTIDEIIQVPTVDRGISGAPTFEQDGIVPHARGIFDDKGRLMVMINWNTDIGDAWEHAEHPLYPLRFSTYAFEIGTNAIIYSMTH